MGVFEFQVLDKVGNDRSAEVSLLNTGTPGLFRLVAPTLGVGRYEVIIRPATDLDDAYIWAEDKWGGTYQGTIDPLFFAVLGAGLALLLVLAVVIILLIKSRKHPLTGGLQIYQEIPDASGAGIVQRTTFSRKLPRRNRAAITPSSGLGGWVERVLRVKLARSAPFRRMVVTCPSDEDSKARRARVKIWLSRGTVKEAMVAPQSQPYPLGAGSYLVKTPREEHLIRGLGPPDVDPKKFGEDDR